MYRIAFISLLTALLLCSCDGRVKMFGKNKRVPDKDLPAVLADLYLADGLLTMPNIKLMFPKMDSISGYAEVMAKYGYTIEQMDRTMKYYFTRKPKKLEKIYDRALGILSEIESKVEKENLHEQSQGSNMWTGKSYYAVPGLSGLDSLEFDILLESPGIYTLTFKAIVFPGDQLHPAAVNAYTCHRDSSLTGKRNYIQTTRYLKDGQPHVQSITISVSRDRPLRLKGSFYDIFCHPEPWEKNAYFTDIILTYTIAAV
jgi:hypothetical protein